MKKRNIDYPALYYGLTDFGYPYISKGAIRHFIEKACCYCALHKMGGLRGDYQTAEKAFHLAIFSNVLGSEEVEKIQGYTSENKIKALEEYIGTISERVYDGLPYKVAFVNPKDLMQEGEGIYYYPFVSFFRKMIHLFQSHNIDVQNIRAIPKNGSCSLDFSTFLMVAYYSMIDESKEDVDKVINDIFGEESVPCYEMVSRKKLADFLDKYHIYGQYWAVSSRKQNQFLKKLGNMPNRLESPRGKYEKWC